LLAAGRTAAISNPEDKTKMINDTTDKNASIRFWAVMGLGNLAKKDHSLVTLFKELLEDSSPSVAIAAARGLVLSDRAKDTFESLRGFFLGNHTEQTKHFALEIVEIMPDKEAVLMFKSIEKARTTGYAGRVFNALKNKYGK
jgi:hypothetical protein